DDAVPMRQRERAADLAQDADDAIDAERSGLADDVLQAAPAHELHRDIERAVGGLSQVVRGGDVRVRQVARRARLALEATHEIGRSDELGLDELDGDLLVEHQVRRTVDRAHAALAEPRIEPVLAVEHFTDPWIASLRRALEHGAILRADPDDVVVRSAAG